MAAVQPYLVANPPARSQYRHPRRAEASGVIAVHTAENTPDFVAFDGGAEAVAKFIQTRPDPGSYHTIADSDSRLQLVRFADEAFHDGTGTNPHSLGLSIATRADLWPLAPKAWRDGAIEQAAQGAAEMARWVLIATGIVVPARRVTAAQARKRVPGFVSHAELDPARRTDPGAGFPWSQFLARFAELTKQTPTTPQEDDMPLTDDDLDAIGARVQAELRKGTGNGQPDWPSTNRAILATIQSIKNDTAKLADVDRFAAALADALGEHLPDLGDLDLRAVIAGILPDLRVELSDP